MDASFSPPRPAPALSAILAPLVVGRRVLLVGDSSQGMETELVRAGARLVTTKDPDRGRAARATPPRGATVHEFVEDAGLDVREGSYDLLIIPSVAMLREPEKTTKKLIRALSGMGVLVLGTPNADAGTSSGLTYGELFDLAFMHFSDVQMVAELPFEGSAFALLGEDEPEEISVDQKLLTEARAPLHYYAFAANETVQVPPYVLVEVPPSADDALGNSLEESYRIEVSQRRIEVELLQSKLDEARQELETLRAKASPEKLEHLTGELARSEARRKETEARAGDAHVRAERLVHDVKALEEELEKQRDRNFRVTRELEDEKKARQKIEVEYGMARKNPELQELREKLNALAEELEAEKLAKQTLEAEKLAKQTLEANIQASRKAGGDPNDVDRFEAALKERAEAIRDKDEALRAKDALVRELLLRQGAGLGAPAPLAEKLDQLAQDLADRDAQLVTKDWRIAELERALKKEVVDTPS